MRIHTDTLYQPDIYNAVKDLPGVSVDVTEHGSRTHARAFEVSLSGNGYRRNTGTSGAGSAYDLGATWDEWGVFLARLFEIDPNALCGSVKYPVYRNGYEFHLATDDRFEGLELPDDTHKRHTWKSSGIHRRACSKCTAVQVF